MTYAIRELVIRHVSPFDTAEITDLVAEAMWDGPVARWLNPDQSERRHRSPAYFDIFVDYAVQYGEVYGMSDSDTGQMTGVALWFPFTSVIPGPIDYERRLKEVTGDAFDRACQLDALMEENHPLDPHHYLAFLAVRPDRQGQGIGSSLLDRHHDRLDQAGLPAYLEANDPRNRDLYLRHGYQVRSVLRLPDGPPLWSMWRSPMP